MIDLNPHSESHKKRPEDDRISSIYLWLLFAVFMALSIVVYYPMFDIKPSCDDFVAPMAEILRGDREGIASFFRASQLGDYRPLQSLTMWAIGGIGSDKESIYFWIHILHLIAFWMFCFVGFLWIKESGLNYQGAIIAGIVMFFHPLMASAVASIDGFGRILVYTFMWLGAYFVFKHVRDNPYKATIGSLVCFIIAIGYMEYAVALIPIAFSIAVCVCHSNRFKRALIVTIPMLLVFLIYYMARTFLVEKTIGDTDLMAMNPLIWLKNIVMIYSSILYFGDTTPVMLDMSKSNLTWYGVNVILVLIAVLWGFIVYLRQRTFDKQSNKLPLTILILFFISCFPYVFMEHISELYVIGIVIVLSILAGYAAMGWIRSKAKLKYLMAIILISQMVIALSAIQSKMDDLRTMGIRTKHQIDSILEHIPDDAESLDIAMIFTPPALNPAERYSNFARDDAYVIHRDQGTFALDWYLPGKNHTLEHELVDDVSEVDTSKYDMVLFWNFDSKVFERVK